MKVMKQMTFLVILLLAGFITNAQSNEAAKADTTPMEDFFIGKWKLQVEDLPSGDGKMVLILKKQDGKLVGTLGDDKSQATELKKVEIEDKTIYITFMGGGYELVMELEKQNDGTVAGMLNDMFDTTGTKVVE